MLLAALQRSDASGGVAVLSALVLDPGLMDRVAALDMEQQSVCAAALAALAEACPTISATGSVGYILMGRSGDVRLWVCEGRLSLYRVRAALGIHLNQHSCVYDCPSSRASSAQLQGTAGFFWTPSYSVCITDCDNGLPSCRCC